MTYNVLSLIVFRFCLIAPVSKQKYLKPTKLSDTVINGGIELGLEASAAYLAQAVALLSTESSRVSFISAFTVIIVPFLAAMSGKKLPVVNW